MRVAKLSSSAIERIGYDDEVATLSIWFRGSGRYVYYGVPASVYEALKETPSAGQFFTQSVKGRFPCRFDPERRRFRPV